MFQVTVVGFLVTIIVLAIIIRGRRDDWPGHLRRLHAGVTNKAEWMASDDIIQRVENDYLLAQRWMSDALLVGYVRFLREAPRYFSGNYLKHQQHSAMTQIRKRGPRLIGVLRAHHRIRVRYFSDDGLTCYVVDHQTERRMATYDYWQLRRLHTQSLEDGAYVYRMVYDRSTKTWKIEELVQQLPLGWGGQVVSGSPIKLDKSLPIASGRDT